MDKFELVSEFKPQGDQPQAIQTLVDGIKKGDNLIFLNTESAEKKICRELPYVESAKVIKSMPKKVSKPEKY